MRPLLAALLLLTTGCAPIVRYAMARPEAHARREGMLARVADDGQIRVRYFVGGEGPPVLLVHGFGGDGVGTWEPQLAALLEGHRVIVPDLVWFGRSWGTVEPTLDAQSRAMWSVLDAEGVRHTDVVCVSYGGFVVLKMFQEQPERLGKVVFEDTPGPFFDEAEEAALLERFGVERAEDIFIPSDRAGTQGLVDLTLADPPTLPGWSLDIALEEEIGRHAEEKRALIAALRAWRGKEIALPEGPLVVWGRDDPVFPLHTGQKLAEASGGRLVIIENARHGPSFEHPDAFNEAILGYLDAP